MARPGFTTSSDGLPEVLFPILQAKAREQSGKRYLFPRSREGLVADLANYLEIQPMKVTMAIDALIDAGKVHEYYGSKGIYYRIEETKR